MSRNAAARAVESSSTNRAVPQLVFRQPTLGPDLQNAMQVDESEDSLRTSAIAASIREDESILRPGTFVLDENLTEELPGVLDKLAAVIGGTASGGFAKVSIGLWEDPSGLKQKVAIKTLTAGAHMHSTRDPEAQALRRRRRWLREATVWKMLDHPNITPLLGIRSQPEPCLVTPWYEHGSLVKYLERHPNTSMIQRLYFLKQAGAGLMYLHALDPPIAHGDIKGDNVLVNDSGEASFCDFGLSRVIQSLDQGSGLTTSSHQRAGCTGFMAPELLMEDHAQYTAKTDVYAFGGLMLQTLTDKQPFWKDRVVARIVLAISQRKTANPADHPSLESTDPLWGIMRKCWSWNPEDRWTMPELVAQIEQEILNRENRPGM